jgi:hypothetical protein
MIAFQDIIHPFGTETDHLIPLIDPDTVPIFTTSASLHHHVLITFPPSSPHLPYPPYELRPIGCLHSSPPPSADLPCHLHRPLMHLSLALHGPHSFPQHVLNHLHILTLSLLTIFGCRPLFGEFLARVRMSLYYFDLELRLNGR